MQGHHTNQAPQIDCLASRIQKHRPDRVRKPPVIAYTVNEFIQETFPKSTTMKAKTWCKTRDPWWNSQKKAGMAEQFLGESKDAGRFTPCITVWSAKGEFAQKKWIDSHRKCKKEDCSAIDSGKNLSRKEGFILCVRALVCMFAVAFLWS